MSTSQTPEDAQDTKARLRDAIRKTAPGTSLRFALDMILACLLYTSDAADDTR